ncbi:hypothetical protein BCR33DRAFT_713675 [Rhizoclosmatium globosum]|uniref:Uncharacterized protein n=1 Tax=Rhizoclosmatium globosum TaxID=329046 RepID=A0A1Y2CSQ2_9FUNG|nr:hypothetical protein BCR33DRAFT_713675 [Rhizoclosmatium globosum]|eukprot:ORY50100.1 hypothetical protein BCR33DRAFT_713675 [Rhizoclosmatium globosum]
MKLIAFLFAATATLVLGSAADTANQGQYMVSHGCTKEEALDASNLDCYLVPIPGGHISEDDY